MNSKIIIIYSPLNLDSCMAAASTATIHYHIASKENPSEVEKILHIPYSRSNDKNVFPSSSDKCMIYILGADLLPTDMLQILDNYPESEFVIDAYQNSTAYNKKTQDILEKRGIYVKYNRESYDEGHSSEPSIGLKQSSFSYEKDAEGYDIKPIRELAGVISKFCQFQALTIEETFFMYANIKGIRKAASGDKKLKVIYPKETMKADYAGSDYEGYVDEVKQIISTNNAMASYAGANGTSFITPTICVTERDAVAAMRFINYSYDEVISFEDTRTCRIYRIFAEKNLQWYIKRFEPIDIWSEGFVTYIKTELPKHVR